MWKAAAGVALVLAVGGAAALIRGGGERDVPAIDVNRLAGHVRAVSADDFEGRQPATPAEQKTIDYLAGQLAAAGVEPGGERDAQGMRTWTQTVPLAQAAIAGVCACPAEINTPHAAAAATGTPTRGTCRRDTNSPRR